jgi:hypothetical protein
MTDTPADTPLAPDNPPVAPASAPDTPADSVDALWAAARLAFETTPETPVAIARRLGLGHHFKVYSRSRNDGWTRYPAAAAGPDRAPAVGTPADPVTRPAEPTAAQTAPRATSRPAIRKPKRQQMIERLYRVIDNNLSQLEDIMKTQSDPSIADNEKETRTIGTVIGNIEKLKGLEDDAGKSRHSTKSAPAADAAETERVRRELAERFYKLSQELRT